MIYINLFNIFEPYDLLFSRIRINYLLMLIFLMFKKNIYISYQKIYFKREHNSNKIIYIYIYILIIYLGLNIIGIIPWVFCSTRHMRLNFPIAIFMWLAIFLWIIKTKFVEQLAHITPINSPILLRFVLVFIETISKLIQPLTLRLRLTANIIAGHMIITLISSFINSSLIRSIGCFVVLLIITVLEIGVCVVQSYIFVYLLYLYRK